MNCLYSFLTALALNPRSQEAFKKDPESFMAAAGLSDQDRTILRNRRNKDIAAAFIDELLAPAFCLLNQAPTPCQTPIPLKLSLRMQYQANLQYAGCFYALN